MINSKFHEFFPEHESNSIIKKKILYDFCLIVKVKNNKNKEEKKMNNPKGMRMGTGLGMGMEMTSTVFSIRI